MIVVSDTSPVSSLIQIKQEHLLPALYGSILVPPEVERELRQSHNIPNFITCEPPANLSEVRRLSVDLDLGEAEAIALAKERNADWLLMDEIAGRRVAEQEGVRFIGLLGVLLEAKRLGDIPKIRPLIDQLERFAHFRISEELKARIFLAANE